MQIIQDYLKTITGDEGGINSQYETLVARIVTTAASLEPNEALLIEQDNVNVNNTSVVQDIPEYDKTEEGRPIILINTPTQSYILVLPLGTDIIGPGVRF